MIAARLAPSPSDTGPLSAAGSRGRIGWIVAGSLLAGFVIGLLLVAAPFVPVGEGELTGALLTGFAVGWGMLAVLSVRFTDQPQRWAFAPALFKGSGGLILLGFGSPAHGVLRWVWPPALLVMVVWIAVRSRQQLRSHSWWLLQPVLAVLLIAAVGGIYEVVGQSSDVAAAPRAGELIEIEGHRLYLRCSGSGTPTVVFEPGGGEMSSALGWVEPAVARHTRVCVYDRAGRGLSESADGAQDASDIATDLHTLLESAGVPGPYVLAGHSFGGLYVLTFADLYPDDVAGMVLIDSAAPAWGVSAPDPDSDSGLIGRVSALLSASARMGLGRIIARTDYEDLPPQSRDEARASVATADHVRSTIDEYAQAGGSRFQAAELTDLAGRPLVVLTAGSGSSTRWMADQEQLAGLSSISSHRVIDGAVHAALLHDERYAVATTQAVLDVVSSIRRGVPLAG